MFPNFPPELAPLLLAIQQQQGIQDVLSPIPMVNSAALGPLNHGIFTPGPGFAQAQAFQWQAQAIQTQQAIQMQQALQAHQVYQAQALQAQSLLNPFHSIHSATLALSNTNPMLMQNHIINSLPAAAALQQDISNGLILTNGRQTTSFNVGSRNKSHEELGISERAPKRLRWASQEEGSTSAISTSVPLPTSHTPAAASSIKTTEVDAPKPSSSAFWCGSVRDNIVKTTLVDALKAADSKESSDSPFVWGRSVESTSDAPKLLAAAVSTAPDTKEKEMSADLPKEGCTPGLRSCSTPVEDDLFAEYEADDQQFEEEQLNHDVQVVLSSSEEEEGTSSNKTGNKKSQKASNERDIPNSKRSLSLKSLKVTAKQGSKSMQTIGTEGSSSTSVKGKSLPTLQDVKNRLSQAVPKVLSQPAYSKPKGKNGRLIVTDSEGSDSDEYDSKTQEKGTSCPIVEFEKKDLPKINYKKLRKEQVIEMYENLRRQQEEKVVECEDSDFGDD